MLLRKAAAGGPSFGRSLVVSTLGSVPGAGLGLIAAKLLNGSSNPETAGAVKALMAAAGGAIGGATAREIDGHYDSRLWDEQGRKLRRKPRELALDESAGRILGSATGLNMPKSASTDQVVQQLLAAKNHSAAKRYTRKQAILRQLLSRHGGDFYVDSPDPRYPGLTHAPSGFRIHAPKSVAALATGDSSGLQSAPERRKTAGMSAKHLTAVLVKLAAPTEKNDQYIMRMDPQSGNMVSEVNPLYDENTDARMSEYERGGGLQGFVGRHVPTAAKFTLPGMVAQGTTALLNGAGDLRQNRDYYYNRYIKGQSDGGGVSRKTYYDNEKDPWNQKHDATEAWGADPTKGFMNNLARSGVRGMLNVWHAGERWAAPDADKENTWNGMGYWSSTGTKDTNKPKTLPAQPNYVPTWSVPGGAGAPAWKGTAPKPIGGGSESAVAYPSLPR